MAEHQRQLERDRAEQAEAELRAVVERDEERGYMYVSFRDLYLDYKSMPLGSKRAVADAFYHRHGEGYETLTSLPGPGFSGGDIVLLTDRSPREVRARLLAPACRYAFCRGTFLGHTTRCTIDWWGQYREDVCFVLDEMR